MKKIIGVTAIAVFVGIGCAQAQNTAPGTIDQPGMGQKPQRGTGEAERTARNSSTQAPTGSAASVVGSNNKGSQQVTRPGGASSTGPGVAGTAGAGTGR